MKSIIDAIVKHVTRQSTPASRMFMVCLYIYFWRHKYRPTKVIFLL